MVQSALKLNIFNNLNILLLMFKHMGVFIYMDKRKLLSKGQIDKKKRITDLLFPVDQHFNTTVCLSLFKN